MPPAPDPAVLAGLRNAIGGPLPLQDKGGKTPVKGLFPAGQAGKSAADTARANDWIAERKERVSTTKGKKTTVKEVSAGWELTETGRRCLADIDSPRPVLEAMLPVLERIANRLAGPATRSSPADPDRAVREAAAACVAAIDAAFGKLQAAIEGEFARARQAVADAPAKLRPAVDQALTRVGETVAAAASPAKQDPSAELARLLPLLQGVLAREGRTAPPAPPPTPSMAPTPLPAQPESPRSAPAHPGEVSRDELRAALKAGYDELCLYVEFRDRLVELPRLYHEVAGRVPGLTVGRFHQELEALRDERAVELHVLNEVAQAREPELAISKNDRLYYYAIWR